MALDERCILSDLPVDQCACRYHAKPEPPRVKVGPSIVAQYNGFCPECGEGIDQGDIIVRTDDGWVHESC
jgi:hypothetical protein